ncbi:hypothetical protein VOH95_002629 [Clostridium perfringens]|uniref:hypothetical protein n=1 Tax=Clostridium perfringens TaxID=1502 RepID=UPI00290A1346|nr:hypothetical protein [Clostridium perfringens]MDU3334587.1 hypothetical protein [Clostridium perfringens]
MKVYALYKGEKLLSMGTIFQIAQDLNVQVRTVKYYGTDAYKRKLAKRKKSNNSKILIELED